jgi:hypothetical protein
MQANNRIVPGVSSFSWNKDNSKVAVCPNNKEIWIFKTSKSQDISKWERIQIMKEVLIYIAFTPLASEPRQLTRLAPCVEPLAEQFNGQRSHRMGREWR